MGTRSRDDSCLRATPWGCTAARIRICEGYCGDRLTQIDPSAASRKSFIPDHPSKVCVEISLSADPVASTSRVIPADGVGDPNPLPVAIHIAPSRVCSIKVTLSWGRQPPDTGRRGVEAGRVRRRGKHRQGACPADGQLVVSVTDTGKGHPRRRTADAVRRIPSGGRV
jgi:hypothetical protein